MKTTTIERLTTSNSVLQVPTPKSTLRARWFEENGKLFCRWFAVVS
ncbi:hypothetical protein [Gloeobacter kilaueensis]|uniref:Uncharacterized protein n=1 Tax=Gloeobacter kilaueensis (strain ATCC BAA-2537 / CCAP 1431/1 / ULC 316 / JS1) TaxID=1183438 RepID=U5QNE7_GLOK1|nr:hypothetical protein [Gloeobacter kilaueensis]AGY59129.1 hypothetical protein GKIL_2883 [Gloeobacter kilaueensis JS1]